jgi:hypothetical protein
MDRRRPLRGASFSWRARVALLATSIAVTIAAIACDRETSTTPSPLDLTGTWSGTGTYPNAPFQLALIQTGTNLRGSYRDRLDTSSLVTGTMTGELMTAVVDFGDAKLNFDGTVDGARQIRGTMRTSALGNTPFPFTMTR